MKTNNKFTIMQEKYYDRAAKKWSLKNKDPVIGNFNKHKLFDYEYYLFDNIDTTNKKALDFGCGPGRNIVRFNKIFKQIDGVDISQICLDKCKIYLNDKSITNSKLYKCNGINLDKILSSHYDIIVSTITLQHIPVYNIRFNYFKEFYRVLKNNGWISIQMAYGTRNKYKTCDYFENYIDAKSTNSSCDVSITNFNHIKNDLEKIGFTNFSYTLTDYMHESAWKKAIFFRAQKLKATEKIII